jgi:hypothetical protein
MTDRAQISREEAEQALGRQDWSTAWDYWTSLPEGVSALEWLETMEVAALPPAEAGILAAQQALGSIGHTRYICGFSLEVEPFRSSLKWIVAALRQELSATGMQLLVEGYRSLRKRGVRDTEIEEFLSLPEPKAAWRKWTGMDSLSD